jgi:TolB protein
VRTPPLELAVPRIVSSIAWSPDGAALAYSVNDHAGGADIFIVPLADPSKSRHLTRGDHPSWSPDGRQLVFERPPRPSRP